MFQRFWVGAVLAVYVAAFDSDVVDEKFLNMIEVHSRDEYAVNRKSFQRLAQVLLCLSTRHPALCTLHPSHCIFIFIVNTNRL